MQVMHPGAQPGPDFVARHFVSPSRGMLPEFVERAEALAEAEVQLICTEPAGECGPVDLLADRARKKRARMIANWKRGRATAHAHR